MKWIKRLLALIAILLLLVVIVAIYLVATFDANDYKERIEAEVRDATGRELTLEGPIGLTLFPNLGLRLEEARLGNAEGFGDDPFAELDVVDVSLAVMPLLRRELDVRHIEADGVRLNLARDEDGRTNWEDLTERAEQARDEAVTGDNGEERTATESRLAMERIGIAGVTLTNTRVHWDDRMTGLQATLDPFRLEVGRFRPGVETPLEMEAVIRAEGGDLDEPVEFAMGLEGLMNVDLLSNRYSIRRLNANFGVEGAGLPRPVGISLETDVALEVADETKMRFERVTAGLGDARLTGLIELAGLGAGEELSVRSELRSNTFSVPDLMEGLGLEPPQTNDPDAFKRVALDLSASGSLTSLELNPFLITVDDTRLTGNARWDTSGERPLFDFNLSGNELNLDRYLPPEVERARTEGGPSNGERDDDDDIAIDLPVELLRGIDVRGEMALERLDALGMVMRNIQLEIRANEGDWRIDPLEAQAYEGQLSSRVRVDVREDTPRYELAADLADLDIGALLEDMQGDDARLMGIGDLELDIATRGNTVNALRSALNGSGSMQFSDGAVRGINVAQVIRRAEARLRGERLEEDEPNQTDFSDLTGTFDIRDGVVHNDDLVANSPLLRVRGEGSADLTDDTLDYLVNTTIVGTLEGQGGRSLEDLSGIRLPIRISGTFGDPSFRLDLEDILRERFEDDVRDRLGEEEERLRDRLMQRLDGDRSDDAEGETEESGERDLRRELERGLRERLR
ncbi:AsmA family protein [Thioalkalivibrio sp. K90mix]|uniref:AsmA family protein n=1 Tax=Thioalkalivibrio sp. (strain K90mix) TaxID=396595 RepID=UPI000195A1C1|nr:AsmA family protein [Thioalkalivibrio sp. K90mix]ADC72973.1 AsmA family protein [Thioalkalivibrio sp. K90mix]